MEGSLGRSEFWRKRIFFRLRLNFYSELSEFPRFPCFVPEPPENYVDTVHKFKGVCCQSSPMHYDCKRYVSACKASLTGSR